MAHHLAELIDKAENGTTAVERARARKDAVQTILKVWEYRKTLPRNADPLKSYENILTVLDRLRPGSSQFYFSDYVRGNKRDQLAVELFDSFSRLVLALLFMKLPNEQRIPIADPSVKKALNEQELRVWTAIEVWAGIFALATENQKSQRSIKKTSNPAKIDLQLVALQWIDDISKTLDELRKELQVTG
jgi:hypothetical protein